MRIPAARVDQIIPTMPGDEGEDYMYGTGLAMAWSCRPHPDEPGMLVIEADLMVDPDDLECIEQAVQEQPRDVVAAPYVCWPVSTKLAYPMTLPRFNHGVHVFGLGCTWLPAKLIESMFSELPKLTWTQLDIGFSKRAMEMGLTVRMPYGTSVKHAHY